MFVKINNSGLKVKANLDNLKMNWIYDSNLRFSLNWNFSKNMWNIKIAKKKINWSSSDKIAQILSLSKIDMRKHA